MIDELDGRTIQDDMGAQDIIFDSPTPERLDVFGYPRERINTPNTPYGGEQLIHNTGAARSQNRWGLVVTGSDMGRVRVEACCLPISIQRQVWAAIGRRIADRLCGYRRRWTVQRPGTGGRWMPVQRAGAIALRTSLHALT